MDVVVSSRHCEVSERFREHVEEKLTRLEKHDHRIIRVEVLLERERNARQPERQVRVELTAKSKGPIVRAEACLDDKYGALDLAMDKLMERLRRAQDRKRVHRGRHTPESVAEASARFEANGSAAEDSGAAAEEPDHDRFGTQGNSPIEVREKVHASTPMGLDQAVREMELVGHDFYLYHDEDTGQPSVVYRRRGWSYGVIHLDVSEHEDARKVS